MAEATAERIALARRPRAWKQDEGAANEKPLLFTTAMVRALIAGTKTQTRRLVKPAPRHMTPAVTTEGAKCWRTGLTGKFGEVVLTCPHGNEGDIIWVRETWRVRGDDHSTKVSSFTAADIQWRADSDSRYIGKCRAPIHLPRRFARLLLPIVEVRAERLQDISREDAMAEGIVRQPDGGWGLADGSHYNFDDPRQCYWSLFESINGTVVSASNPWNWAITFKPPIVPPRGCVR